MSRRRQEIWDEIMRRGLQAAPDVPTAEAAMHRLEAEHPQIKFRIEVGE